MEAPTRSIPPGIRDPSRRIISNKAIGDRVTYIQYSTETPSGNFFTIRCIVKPGGGVPLHYHRHCTEHFKVLRGVLTAVNGSQVLRLKEGEEALVPVNTNHLFRNDSEEEDVEFEGTARWEAESGGDPGVLFGFQQSLYILYGLANDGLCDGEGKPKSLVQASVALKLGDFMFAGGLPYRLTMRGILGVADWIAYFQGTEEELLRRYWD